MLCFFKIKFVNSRRFPRVTAGRKWVGLRTIRSKNGRAWGDGGGPSRFPRPCAGRIFYRGGRRGPRRKRGGAGGDFDSRQRTPGSAVKGCTNRPRLEFHGERLPGGRAMSRPGPPEAVALRASLDIALPPGELASMEFKASPAQRKRVADSKSWCFSGLGSQ